MGFEAVEIVIVSFYVSTEIESFYFCYFLRFFLWSPETQMSKSLRIRYDPRSQDSTELLVITV